MSDPLKYDPRTKMQVKDLLYQSLYEPLDRHFKKRINEIIAKNSTLINSTHRSFIYRGELYTLETTKPPVRFNRLVAELRPTMEEYLSDIKQLNDHELPYVLNYFNQVLNTSDSLQDYLSILPEHMHPPLKKLMESCPCRVCTLSSDKAKALNTQNQISLNLMSLRRARNLLL